MREQSTERKKMAIGVAGGSEARNREGFLQAGKETIEIEHRVPLANPTVKH